LQPLSLEQGLKMRPVFLKIAEIQWDRLGPISEKLTQFIKKLALLTKKSVLFIKESVQKSDSATSDLSHSVEFLITGLKSSSPRLWCPVLVSTR
jgi:hypothetical protein